MTCIDPRAIAVERRQLHHPPVHVGRSRQLLHLKAYETVSCIAHDRSVLDWGCGDGSGLSVLGHATNRLAGLDVSAKVLDIARARTDLPAGTEFLLWNQNSIPFPTRQFDVITCFQVIEHLADFASFFSVVLRQLSVTGCLYLSTPNARWRATDSEPPWNRFHYYEFTAGSLESLLKRFFRDVTILGLVGPPGFIAAEKKRIERARNRWLRATSKADNQAAVESFTDQQGCPWQLSDLKYCDVPQEGLDFLAVCSNPKP